MEQRMPEDLMNVMQQAMERVFAFAKSNERNRRGNGGVRNEIVTIMTSSESDADDPAQCPICLEELQDKCKLMPCSHRFCQYCLFQWVHVKLYCPVCRQKVDKMLFRNGSHYDEVSVMVRNALPILKDFLYQSPTMIKVATKCLHEYLLNHAHLSKINNESMVTFEDLRRGLHASLNNKTVSMLFRCLTYRYNLKPFRDETRNNRDASLIFLKEHPGFVMRILEFAQYDLEILSKFYSFVVNQTIFDEIQILLLKCDLQSSHFRLQLRSLLKKYCVRNSSNKEEDFSFKFYSELNYFAKNEIFGSSEYVQCTSYILPSQHKPLAEIITLTASSDSDIQILTDGKKRKRPRTEDPTPGPSGLHSSKKKKKNPLVVQKEVKKYTKRNFCEMRRIIRNSRNSEYFFRKLLVEIKKKIYNFETILNSKHFAHLTDFFKDVLLTSKLYRSKKLNNNSSKRTLTIEEINDRLNKSSTSSRSHSSSDSLSDSEIALDLYEKKNQSQLNNQVVNHVLSPSHSMTSHLMLMPQVEQIHFENHVFSDSD